ncbi:MAG: peptidase E [Candidatus Moranbacteria bacterium]|nr:peptidase E [Candidatus Moranbacteria bacterium]
MSVVVAIGGGELKDLETLSIDREIVRLTGKKKSRALFIPTASGDAPGYVETFHTVYGKRLHCKTDALLLIREKLSKKTIAEKILSADIIYVGGGNTLRMLTIWRKHGVDILLRKAYAKGCILSGLSAGANCWFRYCSSDARLFQKTSQPFSYMRVRGLDFIPMTVSPHHIREKTRDKGLEKIMRKTPGVGLAIDDNAAVVFEGDRYRIITSVPTVGAKKVSVKKGKIVWEILPKSGKISEMLKKSKSIKRLIL